MYKQQFLKFKKVFWYLSKKNKVEIKTTGFTSAVKILIMYASCFLEDV